MKKNNLNEIHNDYYGNECSGYYLFGANLKNSNIEYSDINNLFFDPKSYKSQKLSQTRLYHEVDTIDDIDLSENDFSNHTWGFDDFLYEILKNVKEYVELFYYSKFAEIKDAEDLDDTRTYVDDSYLQDIYDRINQDVTKIIHKIIPNLMNTKLIIRFKPDIVLSDMAFVDKIITEILNSGKFDGCYLDFYYNYNNTTDKKRIEGYKEITLENNTRTLKKNDKNSNNKKTGN